MKEKVVNRKMKETATKKKTGIICDEEKKK
jgi:hypothetical protein